MAPKQTPGTTSLPWGGRATFHRWPVPAPPSGDMPLCVAFISIFYLDKTPLNFAPSRKQELPPCQSLIYILCHDLVYFRRFDHIPPNYQNEVALGRWGLCGPNSPALCYRAQRHTLRLYFYTVKPPQPQSRWGSLALSTSPTSCLLLSRESRATKADICSRKSRSNAKPEVRAKVRTAGMGVRAPGGGGDQG